MIYQCGCGLKEDARDSVLELRQWNWFVDPATCEAVCPECRVNRLPYIHPEDSVYGVVSLALTEKMKTPEEITALLPGKICRDCGEYYDGYYGEYCWNCGQE